MQQKAEINLVLLFIAFFFLCDIRVRKQLVDKKKKKANVKSLSEYKQTNIYCWYSINTEKLNGIYSPSDKQVRN